jgi:hypothetical protein
MHDMSEKKSSSRLKAGEVSVDECEIWSPLPVLYAVPTLRSNGFGIGDAQLLSQFLDVTSYEILGSPEIWKNDGIKLAIQVRILLL